MVIKIQPDLTLRNNLLAFGFECEEGWHNLINELIKKLDNAPEEMYVTQVKEKYGRLCFYVFGATEASYDIIDEYEKKSTNICEFCGDTLTARIRVRNFWYKTVCDRCALELKYEDFQNAK